MARILQQGGQSSLGGALGGGIANVLGAMQARKQFGGLVNAFAPQGQQPQLNIEALRKVTDPNLQRMIAQMLLQRHFMGQFGSPQTAGEGSPFAPGTVTQRRPSGEVQVLQRPQRISPTEQISQKKLDRINAIERKIAGGTATDADRRQLQAGIGLKPAKSPEERLANWTRVLDVATRPTLNADGSLNSNPLPNVSAEARKQIQSAVSDLQTPKKATTRAGNATLGPVFVNPQTKQRIQWNGSKWVPAQ